MDQKTVEVPRVSCLAPGKPGRRLAYGGYVNVSCPALEKHGATQEDVHLNVCDKKII